MRGSRPETKTWTQIKKSPAINLLSLKSMSNLSVKTTENFRIFLYFSLLTLMELKFLKDSLLKKYCLNLQQFRCKFYPVRISSVDEEISEKRGALDSHSIEC